LFVGDYIAAYPRAKSYAAPGLPERRRDIKFDAVLTDDGPDAWRGQVEQHIFKGAPVLNEVIWRAER